MLGTPTPLGGASVPPDSPSVLGAPTHQGAKGFGLPVARGPIRFAESVHETTFLRGNLHTHSRRSDGDAPPSEVYAYYRDHGYSFLVLTDHNTRTNPDEFRSIEKPGFLMIPGEEVTTIGGGKPVHVNAICSQKTVGGGVFPTPREALEWAVARVMEQGAIALINHPNFEWALTAEDLPYGKGAAMIEIWSGHPHVRSLGDMFHPSHEALWSGMLDSGRALYGAAVDDMHNLKDRDREPRAVPERAWVNVFGGGAPVTAEHICQALKTGRFYSSGGPAITQLVVDGKKLGVSLKKAGKVEFVGAENAILTTVSLKANQAAEYKLQGGERYVRARIVGDDGERAWTQAYEVVSDK